MNGRWLLPESVGGRTIIPALVLVLFACFIICLSAEGVELHESGALPVLVFQTDGKAVQDRTRVPASLTVLLPDEGGARFSVEGTASGRFIVRWDGSGERLNIEATTEGMTTFEDEYYRGWPFHPEQLHGSGLGS